MVRNDVGTFLEKSISGHFGVILGHFGVILGSFWVFWVILSPKNDQTLLTKAQPLLQTTLVARKMAQNCIFSHFVWKRRIFTNFAITDFKIG